MLLATEVALAAGAYGAYRLSKPNEPPVDLTQPVPDRVEESAPVALPDAYPHMQLAPGRE